MSKKASYLQSTCTLSVYILNKKPYVLESNRYLYIDFYSVGLLHGLIYFGMNVMDGWRDGGMEGWRDGWMEGWMDGAMDDLGYFLNTLNLIALKCDN